MKGAELSVVIVNYKSWKLLENCITSFSDFPPSLAYELIVVDNDSQDGEFDNFSKLFPDIQFVKNKGNYGFSNGCNLGASYANGKYLLFLNPDTELTNKNAIDEMVRFLKENHNTGIVSCRTISSKTIERELLFSNPWILLIGFIRQPYKLLNSKRINKQYPPDADVWHPDWVSGSVVLIESALFNRVGKWNQERYWMYHEDPDLCMKVKKTGRNIALLRNVSINHIGGGVSRKNASTSILTKTEVIISSHNYIQSNAKLSAILLHFVFGITTLMTLLAKSILASVLFKMKKARIYSSTAAATLKYYYMAIKFKTWKSPRLNRAAKEIATYHLK